MRGGGMLGPALAIGARFGLPGIIVALVVVFGLPMLMGRDGQQLLSDEPAAPSQAPHDERFNFVSFVFDDAQRVWTEELARAGAPYRKTKLVVFTDRTQSGCGFSSAAVGPFYCPTDEKVYIDLAFYNDLSRRFGAPGDFAQAYVVAHEVGHHVQNVLGIERRVRASRAERQGEEGTSVRLELQADCFAGVWAHSTNRRELLEAGDIDEGLAAASAVGDDRLQKQATGSVQPETWTHGSAAQRSTWFKRGLESGSISACDTFTGVL